MSEKADKPSGIDALALEERKFFDAIVSGEARTLTEAAELAGFDCETSSAMRQKGWRTINKIKPILNDWLEEVGLSDEALFIKLLSKLDAKETKFFADKGVIISQRDVEAHDVQLRAVELIAKMKGKLAPVKHQVTGKDGESLGVVILPAKRLPE